MVTTAHAQCERGNVIGVGVQYIYIQVHLWTKKIESYFSDRLTFSNILGRTFRQIYRLALPLLSPEMLSSLSESKIFLCNVHLALLSGWMTQLPAKRIGRYRHLVNWN